jgi:hypothetical protein
LRQAILSANLAAGVPDVINFNIPGAGPHTISPAPPLPTVTDPNFLHPGGFATNVPAGYYRVRLGP